MFLPQGNFSSLESLPFLPGRYHCPHGKKGVRILPFYLPTQSPWLNPIEPKWVHGKRNVVEGNGLLTANQLIERVSAYYRSPLEPRLVIPEQVA